LLNTLTFDLIQTSLQFSRVPLLLMYYHWKLELELEQITFLASYETLLNQVEQPGTFSTRSSFIHQKLYRKLIRCIKCTFCAW